MLHSTNTKVRGRFSEKRRGSLTSLRTKRISGSGKFRSPPPKDFFNTIDPERTWEQTEELSKRTGDSRFLILQRLQPRRPQRVAGDDSPATAREFALQYRNSSLG